MKKKTSFPFYIFLAFRTFAYCSTTEQKNIKLKPFNFMNKQLKTGARWLQREGTFCVKCSRELTECLTISQKGGALL
jgi:hypothetical protein